MKMFRSSLTLAMVMLLSLFACGVAAADGGRGQTYSVTITNLTKAQPITPPLVISHKQSFQLFMAGHPASDGLAALAEGGDTQPLEALLGTRDDVFDYQVAGATPIMKAESRTVEIKVRGSYRYISLAGMLAASNDAFIAVKGIKVPYFGMKSLAAVAYDAGSEANSELCTDVPACGGKLRVTDGAEGFVFVHNGIRGAGDLIAANMDWRNPVAKVVIKKVHR